MTYTLNLNDDDMTTLLDVVKADAEWAIDNDAGDSLAQDIDLLKSVAYAFNDVKARGKLLSVISTYESKLKDMAWQK